MFWTIAKKEYHQNLLTFRFIFGFLICVILVSVTSFLSARDYAERLRNYAERLRNYQLAEQSARKQMSEIFVYSQLMPLLSKPPSPLSVFGSGYERSLGFQVRVSHGQVPEEPTGSLEKNPLLKALPTLDLSILFKVILSLLALLFSYDTISGEKETRMLSLICSHSLPRSTILFGKLCGGLLSLFSIVVTSFIFGVIVMEFSSTAINLSSTQFGRIFAVLLLTLLYSFVFFALGLFVSALTTRPSMSLLASAFVWITCVFILPNLGSFIASQSYRVPSKDQVQRSQQKLWHEYQERLQRFLSEHPPDPNQSFTMSYANLPMVPALYAVVASEGFMRFYASAIPFAEPLRMSSAERVFGLYQDYFLKLQAQARLERLFAYFSPASLYAQAMNQLCQTDISSYMSFLDQARAYRQTLIEYLNSKQLFSSNPLPFLTKTTWEIWEEIKGADDYAEAAREIFSRRAGKQLELFRVGRLGFSVELLDLDDLPPFAYRPTGLSEDIKTVFDHLGFLAAYALALFAAAHVLFIRYDVR